MAFPKTEGINLLGSEGILTPRRTQTNNSQPNNEDLFKAKERNVDLSGVSAFCHTQQAAAHMK